jgi:hypothetical protein
MATDKARLLVESSYEESAKLEEEEQKLAPVRIPSFLRDHDSSTSESQGDARDTCENSSDEAEAAAACKRVRRQLNVLSPDLPKSSARLAFSVDNILAPGKFGPLEQRHLFFMNAAAAAAAAAAERANAKYADAMDMPLGQENMNGRINQYAGKQRKLHFNLVLCAVPEQLKFE